MNLASFVTFGNLDFSKLTYNAVKETTTNPIDFFVVVGKPNDNETIEWLVNEKIPHITHDTNYGFPKGVNDIYDYTWKTNNYDNLILMGNDVIPYPYCIDSLINLADNSDYQVISALQYDVKSLVSEFPNTAKEFGNNNYNFTSFGMSEPWKEFKGYSKDNTIADMQLYDIQNLCLYKKGCFNSIGYTDVNFYPAYFIDNDYATRIVRSGIKNCSLTNARFFHFWSRTIYQGSGGSNSTAFELNKKYYVSKWGGLPSKETLNPEIKIMSRDNEKSSLDLWMRKLGNK